MNKLKLIVGKTEVLRVTGLRNQLTKFSEDTNISIGGQRTNRVKTSKSLGIVNDKKNKTLRVKTLLMVMANQISENS